MKKLYSTLVILCSFLYAGAQTFDKLFTLATTTTTTNEYCKAGIELSNGKYLVASNNSIVCLSQNGDSLWSKVYTGYGDITKLFFNKNNELMAATTKGKMVFMKLNENNGDTISTFKTPQQTSNSGYTIYDVVELTDGDYILAFNSGGGDGSILQRFTPGSATYKWNRDYAGQATGPRGLVLDDTTVVFAAYQQNSNFRYDIFASKVSINNTVVWTKKYKRDMYYKDNLLGIVKNSQNQYLIGANFTINNTMCPAVLKIGNNGDSLSLSYYNAYKNTPVNNGRIVSISPNGNNGFYGFGYMNLTTTAQDGSAVGCGYMCAFGVNDNGEITGASAFNKTSTYEYYPGSYAGSEGWGTGGFKTSDGYYLVYGTGSKLKLANGGSGYQTMYKGYIAKSDILFTGLSSINAGTGIQLYPVPSSQYLNLSGKTDASTSVIICNGTGQKVKQYSEPNSFFVGDLPSGIYFIQFTAGGIVYTQRFIKQ